MLMRVIARSVFDLPAAALVELFRCIRRTLVGVEANRWSPAGRSVKDLHLPIAIKVLHVSLAIRHCSCANSEILINIVVKDCRFTIWRDACGDALASSWIEVLKA